MKVFYNGKRLKDVYPHATRWQVIKFKVKRFFRKVAIVTAFGAFLYVAFFFGKTFYPNVTYAVQEKVVTVESEKESPVLERIAKCESGGIHYDKRGQVLAVGNKDKTVDIGKYQINNYHWGAKATELGLDLYKEADNKKMAEWIYQNRGTVDWEASRSCWNK